MIPAPPIWAMDCECYRDYFLVMCRNVFTGETRYEEMYPGYPLATWPLPAGQLISFNGINYDFPILSMALAGCDNAALKSVSDDIIVGQLKPWHISEKYGGTDLSGIDHIDLIEVAPGIAGLKIYGGRMHSKRMQDLPIEPGASISSEQRAELREYCANDLQTTIDLYRQLTPQLELRRQMSAEYGIDLRSKSDAQIAEAVIRSEVEKALGRRVYRPEYHPDYAFQYRVPSWIQFGAPGLVKLLDVVREARFTLKPDGSVQMPKILEAMRIRIGRGVYRMGIGGLHSSESSVSHVADDTFKLIDRDVTSYYPAIILTQKLFPSHLGEVFLEVYERIVSRRIEAKRSGNKLLADMLKIVVNGSFGKFGSKWSILYSPELLIQVTLTGQLALLMLIEAIEAAGHEVVSANTDGVVTRVSDAEGFDAIIHAWELVSGLETEATEYRALYAKDVNNYIAVKPDGQTKLKGLYATEGLQKNPTNAICVRAVIQSLVNGAPIGKTIGTESDVRNFLTIRQVKGGAKYADSILGKAVRWYYAVGETRHIEYVTNGNKVARSDGARPLMELPDALPVDLDYDWYVREAESILQDVGCA